MPRIPNTFPLGSWPSAGTLPASPVRHLPSRSENSDALKFRSAPSMRNTAVSAVASSTAVGTLEILKGGSRAEHAATSIWS